MIAIFGATGYSVIVRLVLAAEMWWREYGSGGSLIEMIVRHDEINFELVDARYAKPLERGVKMAGKIHPWRKRHGS